MMSYDHNFTGLDLVAGQKMMLYVVCIELKYNIVPCRYQVLVLTDTDSSTDMYRMHVLPIIVFQISKQSTDNQRHRKIEYRTRIVASKNVQLYSRIRARN